jgi:hypothetical protein
MTFLVGQKIVCIDDADQGEFLQCPVVADAIYTISGFADDGLGLFLLEIRRGCFYWGDSWSKCRFRPIVERKTDISIFIQMLSPEKENA